MQGGGEERYLHKTSKLTSVTPAYTEPQPTYPLHWAATSLMSVTLPHMLLSLDLRGRRGLVMIDVSSSKAPPTATMRRTSPWEKAAVYKAAAAL
jgi:hypothetical protein